jgi:uncharacterized protein
MTRPHSYPRRSALAESPHLTTPAAAARRWTPSWAVVPLAALAWFVSNVVSGALTGDGARLPALESALTLAPAIALGYGVRILMVWAWVARFEGRGLRTLGFPRGQGVARAGAGFLVGLAMFTAVVLVLVATGALAPDLPRPGSQGAAALAGVMLMLVAWLVQGSAEELLYRGFVLQVLARRRVWLGVVVSSGLFALAHLQAWAAPVALLNLALVGVLTCVYALREGGLWGVCGVHAAWNWAQGNLFGLVVSGQDVPGGVLVDLRAEGSAWLTGGPFGVEASLATTVVLLAGIALIYVVRPGRASRHAA